MTTQLKRKKTDKPEFVKAYYTWPEIVKLLNLPRDYFDPSVSFISEDGETCRELVINAFGECFECTVNQYANIRNYETYIFCPFGSYKPTKKQWGKFKGMTQDELAKYFGG